MYSKLFLSALSSIALVQNAVAQSPTTSAIPANPTTTDGIPTIEGALVFDGPPVIGFTGPGGNATIQNGNPPASYVALLPSTNFDNATGSVITGSITGTAASNGTGVLFSVSFTGIPNVDTYGPFVYHIHQFPVPSDGNCTGAIAHLDPTDRGELHACENIAPQTCQAGDLAGKHGNITSNPFVVSYSDLYLSTNSSSPYFFGDKSIVIHSRNATRLTCANFTLTSGSTTTGSPSPSPSLFIGSASSMAGSASVLGGVVAILLVFFL